MMTPPCGCSARSTGWWRRISCFPRWAMSSGSVCAGERQPPRRQALGWRSVGATHGPCAGKARGLLGASRASRGPQGAAEAGGVAYATVLLGGDGVGGGLCDGLRKRLGARGIVELTATVGYYAM